MGEEKPKKLTVKEKRFCDRYLYECKFNGTEAARGVYDAKNDNTLAQIAYQNLRKLHIQEYIDEGLKAMSMSGNEVIARLNEIARGKISDVINEDGKFDLDLAKQRGKDGLIKKLKVKRLVRETKREVDSVPDEGGEIEETLETSLITEEVEFEVYSAHEALRDLGKYHKLFTEKHEHTGKDGEPIRTIELSLGEWRKQAAARREQAAKTQQLFEDE